MSGLVLRLPVYRVCTLGGLYLCLLLPRGDCGAGNMVKPKARKELLPASPLPHGGSVQLGVGGGCGVESVEVSAGLCPCGLRVVVEEQASLCLCLLRASVVKGLSVPVF